MRKLNEEIDKWLQQHGAVPLGEMIIPPWRGGNAECRVSFYRIRDVPVVVERWDKGWELFIPSSPSNEIAESLTTAGRVIQNMSDPQS